MKFTIFDELTSTNDYLKNKKNEEEFEVIIAKNQTNGRGKLGSIWISNEGAALFSFTVKYDENFLDKITIFAGYIVYKVLQSYISNSEKLKFKFPNDIYYEDRKMCGILCEKVDDFIIVGIGVNINNIDFGMFSQKAISLIQITGEENDVNKIIKEIVILFSEKIEYAKKNWKEIINFIEKNNYNLEKF